MTNIRNVALFEINSFVLKVKETVGDVTMLINNAGVVSGKHLLKCSDASIQRTFDVNVLAHFWVGKVHSSFCQYVYIRV